MILHFLVDGVNLFFQNIWHMLSTFKDHSLQAGHVLTLFCLVSLGESCQTGYSARIIPMEEPIIPKPREGNGWEWNSVRLSSPLFIQQGHSAPRQPHPPPPPTPQPAASAPPTAAPLPRPTPAAAAPLAPPVPPLWQPRPSPPLAVFLTPPPRHARVLGAHQCRCRGPQLPRGPGPSPRPWPPSFVQRCR